MPDHPSQRYISPLWSLRSFPGYTYIHAYIHATETASARPESLTGSTRFATECATVEAPLPMHVAPPVLAGDRPPKGGGRAVRGMRPTCYTPCGPHATRPCSAAHFCLLHAAPHLFARPPYATVPYVPTHLDSPPPTVASSSLLQVQPHHPPPLHHCTQSVYIPYGQPISDLQPHQPQLFGDVLVDGGGDAISPIRIFSLWSSSCERVAARLARLACHR